MTGITHFLFILTFFILFFQLIRLSSFLNLLMILFKRDVLRKIHFNNFFLIAILIEELESLIYFFLRWTLQNNPSLFKVFTMVFFTALIRTSKIIQIIHLRELHRLQQQLVHWDIVSRFYLCVFKKNLRVWIVDNFFLWAFLYGLLKVYLWLQLFDLLFQRGWNLQLRF